MNENTFLEKLNEVMDEIEELLHEANEKQKKQLSRLAVEILRNTLSE